MDGMGAAPADFTPDDAASLFTVLGKGVDAPSRQACKAIAAMMRME